jgi:MFS family permease
MKMDRKPDPVQPAVWLIITGAINVALGLFCAIVALVQIIQISNPANRPVMENEAERLGFFAGQFAALFVFLLGLFAAPVIIYGAVKMFNGSSYGWAKAASILAIVPFTSCCFLIGAPIGIWALVVLSRPEVKMFFGRGGANHQPPGPPQYHSST